MLTVSLTIIAKFISLKQHFPNHLPITASFGVHNKHLLDWKNNSLKLYGLLDLHAGISSVAAAGLWSNGESPLSGDSRMVDHNLILIFHFVFIFLSFGRTRTDDWHLPLSGGLELKIGSLLLFVFNFGIV